MIESVGGQNAEERMDDSSAGTASGGALPFILVTGLAALVFDLIRPLIFKHVEQNLAVRTAVRTAVPVHPQKAIVRGQSNPVF